MLYQSSPVLWELGRGSLLLGDLQSLSLLRSTLWIRRLLEGKMEHIFQMPGTAGNKFSVLSLLNSQHRWARLHKKAQEGAHGSLSAGLPAPRPAPRAHLPYPTSLEGLGQSITVPSDSHSASARSHISWLFLPTTQSICEIFPDRL